MCLKDRSEYTESWIVNNIYPNYEYIIADGSSNDKNYDIFKNIKYKNVKYIKYPFDKDIKTYINKVIDALNKINTPFVMRADNDDILIKDGLNISINALEKNSKFGIAQANMRGIFMKNNSIKNPKYAIVPGIKVNFNDIVGLSGIQAIEKVLCPYRSLWYGIYKTDVYKKIWLDILDSKIDNIFLIEYFQTQIALIYSTVIYINKTYYLRLSNPSSSTTLDNQTDDYPNWQKIYFDEKYKNEVDKMTTYISDKLGCDNKRIYDVYRKMYANFGSNKIRIRKLIAIALRICISKFLISLIPYLNGNKIKKFAAIFNYLK